MSKDEKEERKQLEKEHKRLADLQADLEEGLGSRWGMNLNFFDLMLLLQKDEFLQGVIRQIAASTLATTENEAAEGSDADAPAKTKKGKSKTSAALMPEPASQIVVQPAPPVIQYVDRIKEVIKEVIKQVEVRVEVPSLDPLRAELGSELKLLKAVKADAELTEAWLWAAESEGRQLVRLLAMLSEWDEVLSLWSRLADRCKNDQRAATRAELTILQTALELHNLRWRDRAAQFLTAESGATFHHETMERGTTKGSTVAEVWLPGLENAAGQALKKPLVKLH